MKDRVTTFKRDTNSTFNHKNVNLYYAIVIIT